MALGTPPAFPRAMNLDDRRKLAKEHAIACGAYTAARRTVGPSDTARLRITREWVESVERRMEKALGRMANDRGPR